MIKDILLCLERDQAYDQVRDFGLSIAETLKAHVKGVAFAHDPDLSGYLMPNLPAQMLAEMRAEGEKVARATIARFEVAAERSGLSREHGVVIENESGISSAYSRLVRNSDLAILMQSDPDGVNNDALIEASLFDSGRPVIVLPYIQRGALKLDRVVCCWDGSNAATRAIHDALPLLVGASNVELLVVRSGRGDSARSEIGGIEMAKHLARHDVKIEVETTPTGGIDVASVILSHAADWSASLIVMGGYGHSRLREFILGGTTRGILSSMTVPVFMSH
jgi:nucleotide-binding universal stress UspA family protein